MHTSSTEVRDKVDPACETQWQTLRAIRRGEWLVGPAEVLCCSKTSVRPRTYKLGLASHHDSELQVAEYASLLMGYFAYIYIYTHTPLFGDVMIMPVILVTQ